MQKKINLHWGGQNRIWGALKQIHSVLKEYSGYFGIPRKDDSIMTITVGPAEESTPKGKSWLLLVNVWGKRFKLPQLTHESF